MRKARTYTFLALLIALLVFGLGRAISLRDEYDFALQSADEIVDAWAATAEQYARRTFETTDLVYDIVTEHVIARGGVSELRRDRESHEFLARLASQTPTDYLMLVDEFGAPAVLSSAYPTPFIDLSDREWFRAHQIQKRERFVSPSIQSRITNEILFTYSRPIIIDGQFAGVFHTAMKQSFFEAVQISRATQRTSDISAWTLDGRRINSSSTTVDQLDREVIAPPIRAAVAKGDAGLLVLNLPAGVQRAAFRVLPESGIVLVASVPEAEVLRSWRREWRNAILTYVLLTGVLTLLGGFALVSGAAEERLTRRLRENNALLLDALAARDLLIREVHHRVKNNLQVISSLLRINARRTSDVKALVATTQDRIHAMATMHEVIYKADVSAFADLGAYLTRLVASVESANALKARGVNIVIDCEPITIQLDRVTPVGLIVVEALSNAMKHGFPDGGVGRLEIRAWRNGARVRLEVANDGAPLDDGHKSSWGGRLVDALAGQIKGKHSLTQEGDWTVFRLCFDEDAPPTENARDAA